MEQDEKNLDELTPSVSFDEFSIPTYDEWKEEVIGLLKGKDFDRSMFTKTYEDITLQPIYRMEDVEHLTHPHTYPGKASHLRGSNASGYIHRPWEILLYSDGKTPIEANHILTHELEKGTTSVSAILDTPTKHGIDASKDDERVADEGLSLSTMDDVKKVFQNITLGKQEINIHCGASSLALLSAIATLAEEKGEKVLDLHGAISADPIGALARYGKLERSMDEYLDEMAHTILWAHKEAPRLKTVLIDADVYHNGGANGIQEVAYAMATALFYLRAMERRGVSVDMFSKHLRFHLSVGANFFMEIAKLRSIKMVWAQVIDHCEGSEKASHIDLYVSTSTFCQTKYDPYVNILRAASQSFSAVVGGMNGMYVKPFDHCIRPSDEFSRRIARNIQTMEQQEFNFIQPIDPAGGSWYIEPLTEEFTEKTWSLLQEIEGKGGILESLADGFIQDAVGKVLTARFNNLATRKDRAVGNNMYPNMTEEFLEVPKIDFKGLREERVRAIEEAKAHRNENAVEEILRELKERDFAEGGQMMEMAIKACNAGATLGEIGQALQDEVEREVVTPILPHRWTEHYEELRMRTETYVKEKGDNVKIFLANMGPIPQHKARADFVTSFMQVAAFDVLTNDGFATVSEAVEAALASKADVTIICSTDATYPELAPAVTRGIKEKCPSMKVFLAGAPSEELKALCDEAGMDDYISVKSNCYETLLRMQKEKGMCHL